MLDLYHRRINYIRVSITDRCNLRCIYCKPSQEFKQLERSQILSYEEIMHLIRLAVGCCGISKVRLTGGEPLVRKDVVKLIRAISGLEGVKDISLTTNGVLLDEMASDLYQAGLHRLNISLDSLNRKKYNDITQRDWLERVWKGLKSAQKIGFSPIKINMVVIKGVNDDEVLDLAKLSLDYPFHIRFIEFMPIGNHQLWRQKKYFPCSEIKKIITAYKSIIPSSVPGPVHSPGPAQMFEFEGAPGKIGFISPMSNHFCSTCNRIRLTADGKLRNCLFSDRETDIKTALRSGESDENLRQMLVKGIKNKPLGLKIFSSLKCNRFMNSIGG